MTRRWPLLLLLLAACARPRDRDTPKGSTSQSASADGPRSVPVVALRLAARGGPLRAYALPSLTELAWTLPGRAGVVRGAIGFDVAGRRLIYRDSAGGVAAFDLVAFRDRVIAPAGALADLGADGALLTVDHRGAVTESQPWGSRPWPDTLGPGTGEIFSAPNARLLLVRGRHADSLEGISRDGGVTFAAPAPPAVHRAASRDGDAVAFATEAGVTVIEDRDPRNPWSVRLSGTPRAVTFSPSGHRIYVALRTESRLAVVDRFARREADAIALPGPAGALRNDPLGRVIFVRPTGAHADSDVTWVVGVAAGRVLGHIRTAWDTDLPTVSPSGVILDREDDAVVARDAHSLDSLGAVPDGARDYWFTGAWAPAGALAALRQQARAAAPAAPPQAAPAPRAEAPQPAAEPAAPAARPAAPPGRAVAPASAAAASDTTPRLWVQVSASPSEAASRGLMSELQAAHLPVLLVPPRGEGDAWRVVLGPYATRDDAEAAGRSLGRPFFIVERKLPTPANP